ncbi:DUF1214 domain-containing protein [Bartonella sp. G70]|uniref:DUF1214 domain-containing protein n=1 Tax=Bartonella bilalgolemii TaxID=2942911 RepID=A0ABT0P7D3_9HYPH|nr:DUF1214 domain-containing protein [Bartonella sp. G70]MCL6229378.1 DUF1214 domain-containing protein [Bartonella sp. G70]
MQFEYPTVLFNITFTFLIFVFSILCGIFSINYMLNITVNFECLKIKEWKSYLHIGTAKADPYTRARTAKHGDISLGYPENLTFQLWTDNQGHPLHPDCHYLLKGHIPETRLFTLYTADKFLKPYTSANNTPSALHTYNVIYENDGSLRINISPTPQTGNWLASTSKKEFGLILNLYDTSILSTTALRKPMMPSVERIPSGEKCV